MNSLFRLLFGMLLIGVMVAFVGRFVAPHLLTDLGLDWWNLAEQFKQHRLEMARSEDLSRRDGVLAERINSKSIITQQVIAGEITLFEAAASFGQLNDLPNECPNGYRNFFPGNSDGEKLCRQVLAWVHGELGSDSKNTDLVGRLEKQLVAHIKEHGTVILPK